MIIAIVGNIGSGKSVSATKKVVDSAKMCMVNFNLHAKNVIRLRKEHIVTEEETTNEKGKVVKELKVNWEFWNDALKKYGEYHLVLDEVHNIINSRRAVSTWNVLAGQWISQVRKLIGNSENTHIFLITQRINRIDVIFRDLLHMIIYCEKVQHPTYTLKTKVFNEQNEMIELELPITWIIQTHFSGEDCIDKLNSFRYYGVKSYDYRTGFIANPYYQYYNSYEVFGETAYL